MMNELIQGLKNYIESLEDGGIINLVDYIEDEGMEVNNELLIELWNSVKDLNVKRQKVINNVVLSIKVFTR